MTATRLPPLPTVEITVRLGGQGRCEARIRVGSSLMETEPANQHSIDVGGLANTPTAAKMDALANLEAIVKRVREALTS